MRLGKNRTICPEPTTPNLFTSAGAMILVLLTNPRRHACLLGAERLRNMLADAMIRKCSRSALFLAAQQSNRALKHTLGSVIIVPFLRHQSFITRPVALSRPRRVFQIV